MEILNKTISEKAENDLKNLTAEFSKETQYFDITKTTLKGFGAVYHDNPEMYEVYISSLLEGKDFEANLICELLHIKEAESGFPSCGIKNSETVIKEKNIAFFQYLKHSLESAVLDMKVFGILKEMGYDYSFFTNYKLKLIKEINKETNMADKYNRASFAVQFLLFALTAENSQVKEAIDFIDSIFDGEATKVLPMAEKIKEFGLDTEEKAFRIMCYIADEYKLWDVFFFEFNANKVKTHGTYMKYFGLN